MSKVLITGNGFDLFHNLPTKYGHFMAVMETIEELNIIDKITFDDLFSKKFKSEYNLDYNLIIENYNTDKIQFEIAKIEKIKDYLISDKWYQHFKSVLEIETWIDFEMEIEKVLTDFSSIFNFSNNHPTVFNSYRTSDVRVYNNYHHFGFSKNKTWDYENIIEISDVFLDTKNLRIKEKLFLTRLIKLLENFIKMFNRYLEDIVYMFYDNRKYNFNIPFELISAFYTVNYTSTLEKIYTVDKSKITYLHGKTNENIDLQNLIMGVSEIPETIKKNKIYNFSKKYQKIVKASNPRFINIPKNETIAEKEIFFIIGHSLDKSDQEYIFDLFEFIDNDATQMSEIVIFYHNNDDYKNKLNNLFSIIDEKKIVERNKEERLRFVLLNIQNIKLEFEKPVYNRFDYF